MQTIASQQPKTAFGFTLIELMIVMSIIALVMSLVGPLTIQGYEKIQAKEEQMTLQNWIKGNSYRSFATSKAGTISLENNAITFNYQLDKTNSLSTDKLSTGETTDNQESKPAVAMLNFELLTFPKQTIKVNTFGLIQPAAIIVLVNGKERIINLSKKVNGSSE